MPSEDAVDGVFFELREGRNRLENREKLALVLLGSERVALPFCLFQSVILFGHLAIWRSPAAILRLQNNAKKTGAGGLYPPPPFLDVGPPLATDTGGGITWISDDGAA